MVTMFARGLKGWKRHLNILPRRLSPAESCSPQCGHAHFAIANGGFCSRGEQVRA